MKTGSLVELKSDASQKTGVILRIIAGEGSFATWAEIMWADGSVKTLDINKLIEKLPTEHAE